MGHGRTLAQRPGSHNRIRSTNRRSLRCPGPRRLRPSLSSPRRPYHDLRRSWRSPRAPRHHHRGSRWHRSRHFRCRQGQPRPHFLRPPRRPRRRLPSCSTPRFPHGASEASSVTHLRDCGLRSRRSSQHTNVVVPLEAMVGTSIEAWSSATLETVTGAGSIHVYVARSKRWTFTTPNSARANSRQCPFRTATRRRRWTAAGRRFPWRGSCWHRRHVEHANDVLSQDGTGVIGAWINGDDMAGRRGQRRLSPCRRCVPLGGLLGLRRERELGADAGRRLAQSGAGQQAAANGDADEESVMEHAYPTLHVNDAATLSRSPINEKSASARQR